MMKVYKKIVCLSLLVTGIYPSEHPWQTQESSSVSTPLAAGAALIGVAGIYGYHRQNITPTETIINQATAFLSQLHANPFFFYEQAKTASEKAKLAEYLKKQRNIVTRAFGLSSSYFNPKSYTPYLSFSAYYGQLAAQIDILFRKLEEVLKLTPTQLNEQRETRKNAISTDAGILYLKILKIKSKYDATVLPSVIEKLLQDPTYTPRKTLQLRTPLKEQFLKIHNYIQHPDSHSCKGECSPREAQKRIEKINAERDSLLAQIYGGWGIFESSQTRKEKAELLSLYAALTESLDKNNADDVRIKAEKYCLKLVQRFPPDDQWRLIEDFIKIEPTYPTTRPASPSPSTPNPSTARAVTAEGATRERKGKAREIATTPPAIEPTAPRTLFAPPESLDPYYNPWAAAPSTSDTAEEIAHKQLKKRATAASVAKYNAVIEGGGSEEEAARQANQEHEKIMDGSRR